MENIEKLVEDIYENSKIPFELTIDGYEQYSTPLFDSSQNYLTKKFEFENTKCCIKVNAAFSAVLELLTFCLIDKLQEALHHKKSIIKSLVNGKIFSRDLIKNVMPTLLNPFYLVNIYIENNIDDIFSCIKECYTDSGIEVVVYHDNILMVGELEDPSEHMQSIMDTIDNTFGVKYYISYKLVDDFNDISKVYLEILYKIELAKKYNLNDVIFDDKELVVEGIIDSIDNNMKKSICERFNEGFALLDNEMIKTIDLYFKCDLNLSEAAKRLYIHRNTLIYRLDKVEKYTGYDIRQFNNAVLFKIVFFLWNERK